MPIVRIPTPLRQYASGLDAVEAPGSTVGDVLRKLAESHPDLRERVFEESGEVRRFLNVYLNDEDVRYLDDLNTAVAENDEVSIIPNVAGG
jgi:molybdopterin synthase sulfur carrier subunit